MKRKRFALENADFGLEWREKYDDRFRLNGGNQRSSDPLVERSEFHLSMDSYVAITPDDIIQLFQNDWPALMETWWLRRA